VDGELGSRSWRLVSAFHSSYCHSRSCCPAFMGGVEIVGESLEGWTYTWEFDTAITA
jgi:hypothetical protein